MIENIFLEVKRPLNEKEIEELTSQFDLIIRFPRKDRLLQTAQIKALDVNDLDAKILQLNAHPYIKKVSKCGILKPLT